MDNKVKEYKEIFKTGLQSLNISLVSFIFFIFFNLFNNSLTIKDFPSPVEFSEYINMSVYLYNGGMIIATLSFILFLVCSVISLKGYITYRKNNQIN